MPKVGYLICMATVGHPTWTSRIKIIIATTNIAQGMRNEVVICCVYSLRGVISVKVVKSNIKSAIHDDAKGKIKLISFIEFSAA